MNQRKPRIRNKSWLAAVAELESCVRCGKWGGVNATAGGCSLDGAEVKQWPCAA